ncbi:MAG: hypothetical protein AAFV29_19775, partial [Myxococcota bacterium]
RTLPDEAETLRSIAIRRADLLGALGRHEEAVAALRVLPVDDQLLEEVRAEKNKATLPLQQEVWTRIEEAFTLTDAEKAQMTPAQLQQFYADGISIARGIARDNIDTDPNLPVADAPKSRWEVAALLKDVRENGVSTGPQTFEPLTDADRALVDSAIEQLYDNPDRQAGLQAAYDILQGSEKLSQLIANPSTTTASSEQTRRFYQNWAPSADAAGILLTAAADPNAQFTDADIDSVVQGFVSTDPLRNVQAPTIEGNDRDKADAERLHDDLLKSSDVYRDAYLQATWNAPIGPDGQQMPLSIEFVSADHESQQDGQRRSASYDPSSHTIYLRASAQDRDPAALEKLATNLAFEMFNASRGNAYNVLENRVETATRKDGADKNKIVDRAVTEVLDLEQQSVSDYERFRAQTSGTEFRLGDGTTATFGDLHLDPNTNLPPSDSDPSAEPP